MLFINNNHFKVTKHNLYLENQTEIQVIDTIIV